MQILRAMLYFDQHNKKKKKFFKNLSELDRRLLISITPRQKKKLRNKKTVPWQLLEVLFRHDFLPGNEMPMVSMKYSEFIDYLFEGEYKDLRHQYKCMILRDKIMEEESSTNFTTPERYIGPKQGGVLWPLSYVRDEMPGSLIK